MPLILIYFFFEFFGTYMIQTWGDKLHCYCMHDVDGKRLEVGLNQDCMVVCSDELICVFEVKVSCGITQCSPSAVLWIHDILVWIRIRIRSQKESQNSRNQGFSYPDPGGPKTCGSGSTKLPLRIRTYVPACLYFVSDPAGTTCCRWSRAARATSPRGCRCGWRTDPTSWRPTSPSSTATPTPPAPAASPRPSPATGVSTVRFAPPPLMSVLWSGMIFFGSGSYLSGHSLSMWLRIRS